MRFASIRTISERVSNFRPAIDVRPGNTTRACYWRACSVQSSGAEASRVYSIGATIPFPEFCIIASTFSTTDRWYSVVNLKVVSIEKLQQAGVCDGKSGNSIFSRFYYKECL